jgi:hypothetical protein
MHPWQDLSGIGAPVRVFLLSDLLHTDFPAHEVKLAVLLNAFTLSAKLRQAIKTKLQQVGGKTLAWLYAPALFDEEKCAGGDCQPDEATASELVGMRLTMNLTAASLSTRFEQTTGSLRGCPVLPTSLVGSSYAGIESAPHDLGLVSPRMTGGGGIGDDEPFVGEVMGRYNANNEPSLCWATRSVKAAAANCSSVFIGAPRPPVAFWRALARSAGVHLYTADEVSAEQPYTPVQGNHADAVEAAASGLLYHAGSGSALSGRSRRVTLPGSFVVTSEWGDVVCPQSSPCTTFATQPMDDAESTLYWLSKPGL